jgi:hypothetical protein
VAAEQGTGYGDKAEQGQGIPETFCSAALVPETGARVVQRVLAGNALPLHGFAAHGGTALAYGAQRASRSKLLDNALIGYCLVHQCPRAS